MQETPRNKNYKHDINYIMLLTRNVLSALAVWPSSVGERSICKKVCKYTLIVVYYFIIYCTLVPSMLFWLHEKRTRVRIKTLPMLIFGILANVEYFYYIIRESRLRSCFQHIEEDWKYVAGADERKAMLESAKTGRCLVAVCATFLYASGFSFRIVLPLSKGKIVINQNVTIRPLPYPSYLFSFDLQASPIYEMAYTIQCLSGLILLSVSVGTCGLITIFTMHACGQLRILMSLINDLGKEQKKLELDKRLAHIVEHQIRIRSFLRLVEDALQQVCLIEVAGVSLAICIIGYCVIMEWENSNSIAMCSYFISLTTAIVYIFIICYTGEQLSIQAEKVAVASCEHSWYRLPDKKARGMILVMIMSNLPIKITAGKIMDLSFKSFGDILKASGAYLNMLRTVTE